LSLPARSPLWSPLFLPPASVHVVIPRETRPILPRRRGISPRRSHHKKKEPPQSRRLSIFRSSTSRQSAQHFETNEAVWSTAWSIPTSSPSSMVSLPWWFLRTCIPVFVLGACRSYMQIASQCPPPLVRGAISRRIFPSARVHLLPAVSFPSRLLNNSTQPPFFQHFAASSPMEHSRPDSRILNQHLRSSINYAPESLASEFIHRHRAGVCDRNHFG
jgi:hypothetical protein